MPPDPTAGTPSGESFPPRPTGPALVGALLNAIQDAVARGVPAASLSEDATVLAAMNALTQRLVAVDPWAASEAVADAEPGGPRPPTLDEVLAIWRDAPASVIYDPGAGAAPHGGARGAWRLVGAPWAAEAVDPVFLLGVHAIMVRTAKVPVPSPEPADLAAAFAERTAAEVALAEARARLAQAEERYEAARRAAPPDVPGVLPLRPRR